MSWQEAIDNFWQVVHKISGDGSKPQTDNQISFNLEADALVVEIDTAGICLLTDLIQSAYLCGREQERLEHLERKVPAVETKTYGTTYKSPYRCPICINPLHWFHKKAIWVCKQGHETRMQDLPIDSSVQDEGEPQRAEHSETDAGPKPMHQAGHSKG